MSYVRLFLHEHTINTFDFCYFINDQNGEKIQKSRNFLFYWIQLCRAFAESTQATN